MQQTDLDRREKLPASVFRYAMRAGGIHQVGITILAVLVFLLDLAPIEVQRRVINEVLDRKQFDTLARLGLVYVAIVIVHGAAKLAMNIYRGWLSERVNRRLRLLTRAETAGIAAKDGGTRISIVVSEVEPVGGFVGAAISEPVLHGGVLLSIFGYMLLLQPEMAAVAFCIFSPQLIFVPLLQGAINRRTQLRIVALREASGELVALSTDEAPSDGEASWRRLVDRVFAIAMQILRRRSALNFLMNGVHHLGTAAILFVGGWLVIRGEVEVGTVTAFLSGLNRVTDPWGDLVGYYQDITNAQVKYQLIVGSLDRT